MVAVQLGVTADEGLDRLRAYSNGHEKIRDRLAAAVLARRLSFRGQI